MVSFGLKDVNQLKLSEMAELLFKARLFASENHQNFAFIRMTCWHSPKLGGAFSV